MAEKDAEQQRQQQEREKQQQQEREKQQQQQEKDRQQQERERQQQSGGRQSKGEQGETEAQRVARISAELPRGAIPVEADKTTFEDQTVGHEWPSVGREETTWNRGALDKTASDDPAPELQEVARQNPGLRPNPRKVPRVDEKHATGSTVKGVFPEQ
jgi:hypothetical protein